MKSPHYFIVTPCNNERYASISDKFNLSVSVEDHNFTQRIAEVVSTPIGYVGDVEVGDLIVLHHNTFRIQYNNRGVPLESKYHIEDNLFYVEKELCYMVLKKNTQEKIALAPFCFIEPTYANDKYEGYKENEQICILKYKNKEMNQFNNGDVIGVKKDSEYEFNIFNEKLYMINQNRILLIL